MDESTDREAETRERKRKANREYMRRQRALGEAGTAYTAEKQRAWKAANPERVVAHRRSFRTRHPERVREWDRRYREASTDIRAAQAAAYYLRNVEKIKARSRDWEKANPEKVSEKRQRYRARLKNAAEGPVDVDALWTGLCNICGDPIDVSLRKPDLMCRSIDHIIPLSKGGTHTQDNLAWVHLLCNLRKGNKIP